MIERLLDVAWSLFALLVFVVAGLLLLELLLWYFR
jgi:hypothetical protein